MDINNKILLRRYSDFHGVVQLLLIKMWLLKKALVGEKIGMSFLDDYIVSSSEKEVLYNLTLRSGENNQFV